MKFQPAHVFTITQSVALDCETLANTVEGYIAAIRRRNLSVGRLRLRLQAFHSDLYSNNTRINIE